MLKDQSPETAVKLAVLKTPESFGLRQEDVNPLLQFVLIGAEASVPTDSLDEVIRQCQFECCKTVNAKVRQILSGKAKEAVISENSALDDSEIIPFEDEDDEAEVGPEPVPAKPQSASAKGNGKRNGSGASSAKPSQRKARPTNGSYGEPNVSVKQLRYIGYLLRQLDEEPDYKQIAELTQKQATQRIRELESELASK